MVVVLVAVVLPHDVDPAVRRHTHLWIEARERLGRVIVVDDHRVAPRLAVVRGALEQDVRRAGTRRGCRRTRIRGEERPVGATPGRPADPRLAPCAGEDGRTERRDRPGPPLVIRKKEHHLHVADRIQLGGGADRILRAFSPFESARSAED